MLLFSNNIIFLSESHFCLSKPDKMMPNVAFHEGLQGVPLYALRRYTVYTEGQATLVLCTAPSVSLAYDVEFEFIFTLQTLDFSH